MDTGISFRTTAEGVADLYLYRFNIDGGDSKISFGDFILLQWSANAINIM